MRKVWLAPWLLTSALLCGCRQPEPASQPPPHPVPEVSTPATVAPADTRPVIACFGDSITAGFRLDPGESFPDLLQQDLDQRGYHYRVLNLGISGDTTQDGLARLPLLL